MDSDGDGHAEGQGLVPIDEGGRHHERHVDRWVSEEDDAGDEFSEWLYKRQAKGKKALLGLTYKEPPRQLKHGHVTPPKVRSRPQRKSEWDDRMTQGSIPTYDASIDKHVKHRMGSKHLRQFAKKAAYQREAQRGRNTRPRNYATDASGIDSSSSDGDIPMREALRQVRTSNPKFSGGQLPGPSAVYKSDLSALRQKKSTFRPQPPVPRNAWPAGRDRPNQVNDANGMSDPGLGSDSCLPPAAGNVRKKKFGAYGMPNQPGAKKPRNARGATLPSWADRPKGARDRSRDPSAANSKTTINQTNQHMTIDNSVNINHNTITTITTSSLTPAQQEELLKLLYLQQEVERLRTRLSASEAENTNLQAEVNQEKANVCRFQVKLNQEMQKKTRSSKKAEEAGAQLKDLRQQIEKLDAENKHFKGIVRGVEAQREKNRGYEQERLRLTNQIKQKDAMYNELKYVLRSAEQRVKELEYNAQSIKVAEVAQLDQAHIKKKLKSEAKSRHALERRFEELQQTNAKLMTEIQTIREEKGSTLEALKKEHKRSLEETRQRQEQASQQTSSKLKEVQGGWQQEKASLTKDLKNKSEDIKRLEGLLKDARDAARFHEIQAVRKQEEAAKDAEVLKKELDGIGKSNQDSNKHLETKIQEIQKLQQEVRTQKTEVERLQQTLKKKEDQLAHNETTYKKRAGDMEETSAKFLAMEKQTRTLEEALTKEKMKLKDAERASEKASEFQAKQFESKCEKLVEEVKSLEKKQEEAKERASGLQENVTRLEKANQELKKSKRDLQKKLDEAPKLEDLDKKLQEADTRSRVLSDANAGMLTRLKKEEEAKKVLMELLAKNGIPIPGGTNLTSGIPSVMRT